MQAGDRVKLKPSVAQTFTRQTSSKQVDWSKRIGDVLAVSRTCVTVKWDGRKSVDQWPENALVVVNVDRR